MSVVHVITVVSVVHVITVVSVVHVITTQGAWIYPQPRSVPVLGGKSLLWQLFVLVFSLSSNRSVNVAFDPFLRRVAGFDAMADQYGDLYSYEKTARARIFARDAPHVERCDECLGCVGSLNSLADMKKIMRYNDFRHDPMSSQLASCRLVVGLCLVVTSSHIGWHNCTPANSPQLAIACRADLAEPVSYSASMCCEITGWCVR